MTQTIASARHAPLEVGFIGLGHMGAPMAANLLRADWPVTVWNRSPGAAQTLAGQGARIAAGVAELRDADVIIFMLPDLAFIEEAAMPLLAAWRESPPEPGTAVLVMSSVSPQAVQAFGAAVSQSSGGHASVLDAPVSGGTVGAENGTLAIMVGGTSADFERARPVLESMGTTVRLLGQLGSGSLAKACNQLLVGTTTAALAEAAELAERSGMDVAALFEVLSGGLAGSAVLSIVGPRITSKDYTPTGPAKFMHKDLGFVLDSAAAAGSAVPMATAGHALYGTLTDQGLGEQDLAVVRESIARLGDVL
ncbi:2-hydroxy-3-oxopropionate reductase [Arthrobacter sp. PAMC 25486]|uniref:NAD(P)-dependent oxidoreductase n=1 Tax=Arthrobacter sp. PAMC 25486 TaxID=1494608 RepID=UPI0005360CDE|nr:NAD(P)-dependent oxidoreductase [Arthrobacter sp. PAMC 25486]AIY00738.1 2-hydroxy-3-oxopropionate reductase [Arthrobacter sp. PAMC 25486]